VQDDRKSTQRQRLLDAMVHVAVRDGYTAATIAEVIAHAGVSRPTFYEYFSDKEHCFLAAVAEIQHGPLDDIAQAVADTRPEHAVDATIRTLVRFAASQPQRAQLLMSEPMAGGPRVLDARDQGLREMARIIDQAHEKLPADAATPDFPTHVMLGTVHRLLARPLRQEGHVSAGLGGELLQWIKSYERPVGEHRWREPHVAEPPEPWGILPETLLSEPAALHRRRGRDSKTVAQNQRQRILFATAAVAKEKGYAATTIGEIRKRAGVDAGVFKEQFTDKQQAFTALIALGFHRTMAASAGAFITASAWPDRVWEAGRAFTELLQASPALAHVGFVEPYAVGPHAAEQVEDILDAFTIFLQEGLRHAPRGDHSVTDVTLQAVATSIFETGYLESRRDSGHNLSTVLPHMIFLCLAPVIGTAQANAFIDAKLNGRR
jgi:AcrR family transcriptional regulator